MSPGRRPAVAVALACAAVAAGCGLGPGQSTGSVELRVTRGYGTQPVIDREGVEIQESDTVLRLLDGEADLGTRYGGKFVQSVNGVEGTERDGRRHDWFFYLDGVESPTGAADVTPTDGQDVWWDYRDWSSAMRVPAVVGAFPEPFAHGFEGEEYRTRIDCLGERAPCAAVQASLKEEGVESGIFESQRSPGYDAEAGATLRILVGPWSAVGEDPAAAQIEEGPASSGVFARFEGEGGAARLVGLSERGKPAEPLAGDTGLIAAVRFEERPPTWVITAGGPAGVSTAAAAFDAENLADRYAVIVRSQAGGAFAASGVPTLTSPPSSGPP